MASLLRNEYSRVVDSFVIVDCRYPYEYDGGHIRVGIDRRFCHDRDLSCDDGRDDDDVDDCSDDADDGGINRNDDDVESHKYLLKVMVLNGC